MTAAEIIEQARKAQEERDGVRLKVRVPSALWRRVRACADACGVSVEEYVCGSCRGVQAGRLKVPICKKTKMGTSTETAWVRVPHGFDAGAASLRPALFAATEHTAAKIGNPEDRPVEGVNYFLAGKDYRGVKLK